MKYQVNKKRAAAYVAALLVFAGTSIYASLVIGGTVGLAIHLSLCEVTAVAVLWLIFRPLERKEANEEEQTIPECHDCGPRSSDT